MRLSLSTCRDISFLFFSVLILLTVIYILFVHILWDILSLDMQNERVFAYRELMLDAKSIAIHCSGLPQQIFAQDPQSMLIVRLTSRM